MLEQHSLLSLRLELVDASDLSWLHHQREKATWKLTDCHSGPISLYCVLFYVAFRAHLFCFILMHETAWAFV